jgi:hypothetical protein
VVVDSGVETDPTLNAITALSEAVVSSADDLKLVDQELKTMRRRRLRGWSWRRIVAASGSVNPLGVTIRIAATLGQSSGVFRRTLALALRQEGMKVTEIASLFAVSRQRVSALVHPRRRKLGE